MYISLAQSQNANICAQYVENGLSIKGYSRLSYILYKVIEDGLGDESFPYVHSDGLSLKKRRRYSLIMCSRGLQLLFRAVGW